MNFTKARNMMIDGQLRPNEISDPDLVKAFRNLRREDFVAVDKASLAYGEAPIPLGAGRSLWSPMDTGKLIAASSPQKSDMVLVVGAGTGYEAGLLAKMCEFVIALEDNAELAEKATDVLTNAGVKNVTVVQANLDNGAKDQGPFDLIFVCGAVDTIPSEWAAQLNEGGRLAVVQAGAVTPYSAQIYVKTGDNVSCKDVFECVVPKFAAYDKKPEFVF